ncbi:MAG: NAD(P)H-dependent oxidoreductase [Chitinophagaceae bacterium]|nr:NAD(P)H-dependent oxidoreductase [Chitinophagaceae bacterium]MCW5927103.1 NAD(P)H-dependent oxidoreductase [Chitinophagaceae bacterium]
MSDTYTVISGTNRPGSNTIRVAKLYHQLLQAKGIEAGFLSLEGINVTLRNTSIEALEKEILIPTQKFIFIVPEYNGSFPGVLKSLLDNTAIEKVWWGKKAMLTGVSTGRAGNLRGLDHLTGVLHYLKMHVFYNKLPISVVNKLITVEERIEDVSTLKVINEQLDGFIQF